mmetsp:Transcript_23425/g.36082  ORF Transcript_23425/g.36082 Transcript_23425/m.36082 type:complete len:1023 (+) Transcript_23425:161-3229(+)|eukprot:CAMPEP_0196806752 /NCGR_PEP_ID=MMETSP1362-20130617/6662_1 /TAXON_ID=163516 /ORGANISM="Leptocylindrus danicus, Strain CCMP1856" /LENGTH=1022 /DNA_ID=CAMNT_0042180369 /DNA_START=67 /DNA_END=3135 /DNA_ORIENTATION=+
MSAVGGDERSGNAVVDYDTDALVSNQSTSHTEEEERSTMAVSNRVANPVFSLGFRWGRFAQWFGYIRAHTQVTTKHRAMAFAEEYELVSLSQHSHDAVYTASEDVLASSVAVQQRDNRNPVMSEQTLGTEEEPAIDLWTVSSAVFTALSVATTTILSFLPTIIFSAIAYDISDRMYPSLPLYLLRLLDAISTTPLLCSFNGLNVPCTAVQVSPIVLFSVMDAYFFGVLVPRIYWVGKDFFFTEADGTLPIEWGYMKTMFDAFLICSYLAALARLHLVFSGIILLCSSWIRLLNGQILFPSRSLVFSLFERVKSMKTLARFAQASIIIYFFGLFMLLAASLSSSLAYLVPWDVPAPLNISNCDPLDNTECILPFPSSFYLREDASTVTGYRVHLTSDTLPLKGSQPFVPGYLNQMDGFSTLAPILFYVHGLKEGGGKGLSGSELQGPESIGLSVTSKSITLLVDVGSRSLVPHFTELDFLDKNRPIAMVQPAKPLRHNARYAVAVVNATGADGLRLSPTLGFSQLLNHHDKVKSGISNKRAIHFQEVIFPSFRHAVPWYNNSDPTSLQLLFDFHTASSHGQLSILRTVRDSALKRVSTSVDWFSDDKVEVIKVIDRDCASTSIARSIYAELPVPWFLDEYGNGKRGATLVSDDPYIVSLSDKVGKVKLSVHVPCSVKQEIIVPGSGKLIQAFVDWGHGVLFSRGETDIYNFFLHKIANDNGYVIVGADWRGMTRYDLPVIIKCLMSRPSDFHAVRDNLIQGFVNKLCVQYFVKNKLIKMDWFKFNVSNVENCGESNCTVSEARPEYVFYGNSQGGILGAGYNAFVGDANLISRTILGVPGTPLALVIGRSSILEKFKDFLLFNLYHHRHTRILLSLFQMGWDTLEASGLLAQPVNFDSIPRVLMQSGVGDSVVANVATEILARSYRASLLPGNARQIFGLDVEQPANAEWDGPHTTLTELYFEQEVKDIGDKRTSIPDVNHVHHCVHRDSALKKQLIEFIDTGKVIDPCTKDNCWREGASNHC